MICLVEQWLVGFGAILAGTTAIWSIGWCLSQLLDFVLESTGILSRIIECAANALAVFGFLALLFFLGDFIGKELLASWGICHLR